MKPMILVTGGCGYIGSHVVKALGDAGESVIVFDNLSQGGAEALLHGEPLVIGDIRSKSELEEVFLKYSIETVIHLAALVNAAESVAKAKEYQQVNALGSKNVWEIAKKYNVKHCIYASSAAVYGNLDTRSAISEDYPTSPSNPYGETKLAGEQSLQELMSKEVGNYLIFRFFNVGGAESTGKLGQSLASRAIMQRLYHAALSGQEVTISGADYDTIDGTVMRDFVHVEDIARAVILGLDYLRCGRQSTVLNLGSGTPHSVRQVIAEVQKCMNMSLNIVYGPPNPGDISYSLADINRARQVLGWEPKKSFAEIISSGYHSYRSRYV